MKMKCSQELWRHKSYRKFELCETQQLYCSVKFEFQKHNNYIDGYFIQIQNFYCSDDSFQTPLESPCAEQKYYFNNCGSVGDDSVAVAAVVTNDPRPKLVLTPPDVNEAFAIEDSSSNCQ